MTIGWRAVAMLSCGLVVAGCAAVGPNYRRPAAIVSPAYKEIKGWKAATPRDGAQKGEWWKALRDPTLDRLEAEVAVSNQTVAADEANYRQALALIAEARAGLYPTLNFNPTLTRGNAQGAATTVLSAELTGAWTLDIWGRTRRAVEEQQAAADVAAADLANARLAAQAALALAFVQLRQADSLSALLARTVASYKKTADIVANQYRAGTALSADLYTAQALLFNAEAQQVNAEVARADAEHAIAVLTGKPPAELSIGRGALQAWIPTPPVGVPSALLERRPDIAAAERAMREQNAAIGVAFAGYFPAVTLTGAFGYIGDPFVRQIAGANPVWNFALGLAQPLYNGGLTDAEVQAARAAYDAAVANYRQTTLAAIQGVEDQLSTIRLLTRQGALQDKAVAASNKALDVALNEYRAGTQSYVTVATEQQTALSNAEQALATRAARLTAVVNLIVDLGGGWSEAALDATN